jgi:dolichol-phosphate mannosyltransferase
MDYLDTTVIIPTLNESKTILELIKIIESLYPKISIIIADDGSEDGTKEIVKKYEEKNKNVSLLDRSQEKIHGLTASVIDAIKLVKTKYFVVIDADLQHPPEKIKEIHNKLRKGDDLVICVRKEVASEWPLHRKLMSRGALLLGNFVLFLRKAPHCSDILSGFFGADTKLVKNLIKDDEKKFELSGYKILFDILKILPKKEGEEWETKISEVPYVFGARKFGGSKIHLKHILAYLKSLFR